MKIMKKAMAFFLCVVMTMAMGISAFAANTGYSIAVTDDTSGQTYKAYQVFKGSLQNIDGKPTLGDIKWGTGVNGDNILTALKSDDTFKKADGTNAFADCTTAAKVAEILSQYGDDSTQAIKFADIVGKNLVAAQGQKLETTGTGTYQTNNQDPGYYLIKQEGTGTTGASVSRNILQVVDNVTVNPKTVTPDIDKKIIDTDSNQAKDNDNKKTDTAAIGDEIEYEISGNLPNTDGYNYYYYIVNDTLSKGLTLKADSFEVKVVKNGETVKTLASGTDYALYTQNTEKKADGTYTFQLAVLDMKGLHDAYGTDATISIKYKATVNSDAEVSGTANTNTAKLQYSNNPNKSEKNDKTDEPGKPGGGDNTPTGEGENKITKTYVTELELIKVDNKGNRLEGAEFTLTGTGLNQVKITTATEFVEDNTDGTYWKLNDGSYTTTDPSTDGIDSTKYASTQTKYSKTVTTETVGKNLNDTVVKATVGKDGVITFTGLGEGSYKLEETKVPDGYNKAANIEFTISAAMNDASSTTEGGSVKWSVNNTGDGKVTAVNDNTFTVTVQNNPGSTLPSTGGIGTTIFYVVGGLMMAGAAVLLVTKRRMTNG